MSQSPVGFITAIYSSLFEPSSNSLLSAAEQTALPQHTQKHVFTSSEYHVSQAIPALTAERDYAATQKTV